MFVEFWGEGGVHMGIGNEINSKILWIGIGIGEFSRNELEKTNR